MKIAVSNVAKHKAHWERIKKLTESYRCKGGIKAEGKSAKPPVCFRVHSEGNGSAKTTIIELHSRVTGKKIGFFGARQTRFVKDRAEARIWNYLNGMFAEGEFHSFLDDAISRRIMPWNVNARKGLKEMIREAKKTTGKK